jgi:carboxypeptidase Taq
VSTAFEALKARIGDVVSLNNVVSLVSWDQQTYMPPGAAMAKARHLEVLSRLIHEMMTSDEMGKLIEAAKADPADTRFDSLEASLVRIARRDFDRARKLPLDLVAELTRAETFAHEEWVKARATSNFRAFIPALTTLVDLKHREIACKGYQAHPYDALLDNFEIGLTVADVEGMFEDLRAGLVPLVKDIRQHQALVDDSCLHQHFPEAQQRHFAMLVAQKFGYDVARGRLDTTVHPFCTSFSRDDVRITTRFDPQWLNPALFGVLHEAGHGLYEQGVDAALEGTNLCGGTSLGVHESQSRLWENVVGRSRGFWAYFYPTLQATFPTQLGHVPLDTFYRAVNKVQPSFIRVEADEATYNLHILLRFELERDLFAGKLAIKDIPDAWNANSQAYLGVTPPDDALGCLQDIHWSFGGFGYFPTYSMGNLLSVQLYEAAVKAHPGIPAEIAQGEFATLLTWMRTHIHQHGSKFEGKDVIQRATGEAMQSRSYMAYLKTKYSAIYQL